MICYNVNCRQNLVDLGGFFMEFKHFGVMIDCSRNAVMKVDGVKKLIVCLEKMGYNALELYTEDTYEVDGEPYFGHLRGRYTSEELKELDAFAKKHGVELIPCIQTLAHLETMFRWHREYAEIRDADNILLVGADRTYQLIENMFKSIASNFTTRNVNIGLDEAFMVGRGKYLDLHGKENSFDILLKHLEKVAEIAKKYGFHCHMWSDMFFRLINNGRYYGKGLVVPEEARNKIPENVDIAYWDYYNTQEEVFDEMLKSHLQFPCKTWFVGGAWTWQGFAPLNQFSINQMRPAMKMIKKHKIESVILSMWGDNGGECSFFSVLPALYAIRQFADGNFDQASIERGFKECFGCEFADFMLLDLPNRTPKQLNGETNLGLSRSLFYNDAFLGIVDPIAEEHEGTRFDLYAKSLLEASERVGEFGYLFKAMSDFCATLHHKVDLGRKTRKAYNEKDKKQMKLLVKEYQTTIDCIKRFYQSFRTLWFKENKPFGWEVQDARFGGLILRLTHLKERLQAYCKGKVTVLEELEQPVLKGYNSDAYPFLWNQVVTLCSI